MTTIEKQIIGMIALMLTIIITSVAYIGNKIDEAGGLKAVVIDAGKEVKDIVREIQKD